MRDLDKEKFYVSRKLWIHTPKISKAVGRILLKDSEPNNVKKVDGRG